MKKLALVILMTAISHTAFASGAITKEKESKQCDSLRSRLQSLQDQARKQSTEYLNEQIRKVKKEMSEKGCN